MESKVWALSMTSNLIYKHVVTGLQETLRLMAEIDAAIPHWPLE